MLDVLYELPEHADRLRTYTVTPEVVRHKAFKKGKRTYRKRGKKRETA